jgi:2,3-bisphosphoglycerate-dependent phosphoglycerate mutase
MNRTAVKRIWLVRHCKAAGQEPEAPLTADGGRQAEQLAAFFGGRRVDRIVSSPYERAIASIRPYAARNGIAIETDGRLRERVLSTEPLPDWMERLRASFDDMDLRLPGGETSREAMERGYGVIRECWSRPEANTVVVTHGNLMALILKACDKRYGFEEWRKLANPDVYELLKPDGAEEIFIRRLWHGAAG